MRLRVEHTETDAVDGAEAVGAKFRTTPITSTIQQVKQLPQSAILYKCLASSFWQFRVYLDGAQRKRSTKKTDLFEAQREAKLIYADMLQQIHGSEQGKRKLSSKRTLHTVANSLWEKQAVMVSQGELNPQKNRIDKYVYDKHIKLFFRDYELKDINADTLVRQPYPPNAYAYTANHPTALQPSKAAPVALQSAYACGAPQ